MTAPAPNTAELERQSQQSIDLKIPESPDVIRIQSPQQVPQHTVSSVSVHTW